jgi:hyaluronan synthase
MIKSNCSFRFKPDHLYPWILSIYLLTAATLFWSRLADSHIFGSVRKLPIAKFGISLGSGLMFLALFVLIWRVWMARRYRPFALADESALPEITVVIPAYNEGSQILDTVRSIMRSDYPVGKMQVICVDDGSTDDTWQWMLQAKREYPMRTNLVRQRRNGGKRHALMAGFRQAQGRVYVTIDSDSEVLPDTLRYLVSPFVVDERVGAVAGNVRVLNRGDGAIPKMMDVFFTSGFDFIRAGQSVYGGVFCTPGALSAYRASAVKSLLRDWANQVFLGVTANIGEDRAMTNLVLKAGHRVVYQRKAVVLTKLPATYKGLRRMLLRWARSNVRENLVMASFMLRRFRQGDGGGWVRFYCATQLIQLTLGEALKAGLLVQLLMHPILTFGMLTVGCMVGSILPATIYHIRHGSWFGWRWAAPYSFFWLYGLSWISFWALMTASRSGWLTRGLPSKVQHSTLLSAGQYRTLGLRSGRM